MIRTDRSKKGRSDSERGQHDGSPRGRRIFFSRTRSHRGTLLLDVAASFGARLKAQRERQCVTLETIAEQTKIRLALLQGLERDDVSLWPGGIFRRSYFRSYSAAIGLDPELAVREFLVVYPSRTRRRLRPFWQRPSRGRPVIARERGSTICSPRPSVRYRSRSTRIGTLRRSHRRPSRPIMLERTPPAAPVTTSAAETGADLVDDFDGELELESHADVGEQAPSFQVDLAALAQLCARIVKAGSASDLEGLLDEAARILHAVGIIVWPWDPARGVLVPSLSHGYPGRTLARLPTVAADADNPIGAAFRSSARQVVAGSDPPPAPSSRP